MIEVTGDLWTYPADIRVITTNGSIRKDGCAVMGRGCAREAALKFPELPARLGEELRLFNNHVFYFPEYALITFPVKSLWFEDADTNLIAESVREFATYQYQAGRTYVMPRPGCGNGRLKWAHVRPLLAGLPDSVAVIDYATPTRR